MTQTPEAKVKRDIKKYLKSLGIFYVEVPGGAYGKKGASDIIVCYNGHFLAVEAKAGHGSQSDWQKLRQHQIEASGGTYITVWTLESFKDFLSSLEPIE